MKAALVIATLLIWSQPAAAQETVALAIEGWSQKASDDGIVTYRCAS